MHKFFAAIDLRCFEHLTVLWDYLMSNRIFINTQRKSAREALIEITGRERYEHLINSLGHYSLDETPRLRYWHESLLEKLAQTTGISTLDFTSAKDLLLHCDVHNQELKWIEGWLTTGNPEHTNQYLDAMVRLFPHSHEVEFGRSRSQKGKVSKIFCCESCIAARKEWVSQKTNGSFKFIHF
jgi:hypothetical protein